MEKATHFDSLSQERKDNGKNKLSCQKSIFYKHAAEKEKTTDRNSGLCFSIGKAMAVPVLYGAYGVSD